MTAFVQSRILSSRQDGHDDHGNPGDCLRACIATVTGLPYELVPHFAQHVSWWDYMRRWARRRGADWACVLPVDGSIRHAFEDPDRRAGKGWYIGSGPSPRGPFRHVVVVDADLQLVHDPHPSGAGVTVVDEVFVWCQPLEQEPQPLTLIGAAAT
jgi:hypothetical protein